MIFELFIFLTLIILGLVVIGVVSKHPSLILLGAIFCIFTGAGLMSEGLRDNATPTFVRTGGTVVVSGFNSFTTGNNITVGMIAPLYFWGGWLLLVLSLLAVLFALKERRDV